MGHSVESLAGEGIDNTYPPTLVCMFPSQINTSVFLSFVLSYELR